MTDATSLLKVREVATAYDKTQVLFGVDLDVKSESLTCLMGHNGAGKTSLMNTIMGIMPATGGVVQFEDEDITALTPSARVKRGLAYVPQGREGFPHLTVMENLEVVKDATSHKDKGAINDALDLFPRLVPILERPSGFLSGGQKQQLAIARALITRPKLMVLDEPTEGIQPSIILEIEKAITEINESRGMAILLVEQYVEFAVRLADNYIVMEAGEVTKRGLTADLDAEAARDLLAV
ncbi:MAG: urea ABC transporter ATP-binding subunit UrtE [Solirubrobacterales bacterium]|nr:urea ABC transporter ATP-binding subunit UrtE [Solirubrobacterales bacterium]